MQQAAECLCLADQGPSRDTAAMDSVPTLQNHQQKFGWLHGTYGDSPEVPHLGQKHMQQACHIQVKCA